MGPQHNNEVLHGMVVIGLNSGNNILITTHCKCTMDMKYMKHLEI